MLFRHHIDTGTWDLLVGLSVRDVRVNTHFSLVLRLRASGSVTALGCRRRTLPYISCHNSTSGDVSRPVLDIWGGVQFVMDINTEGWNNM
jgi:hypothetical protein